MLLEKFFSLLDVHFSLAIVNFVLFDRILAMRSLWHGVTLLQKAMLNSKLYCLCLQRLLMTYMRAITTPTNPT